ncbi:hypothetical protein HDU80_000772 [Chytriomyces hyalinus]|nr:hypothetical protein HDU80_000772 [Chytriomyces hyalinus]
MATTDRSSAVCLIRHPSTLTPIWTRPFGDATSTIADCVSTCPYHNANIFLSPVYPEGRFKDPGSVPPISLNCFCDTTGVLRYIEMIPYFEYSAYCNLPCGSGGGMCGGMPGYYADGTPYDFSVIAYTIQAPQPPPKSSLETSSSLQETTLSSLSQTAVAGVSPTSPLPPVTSVLQTVTESPTGKSPIISTSFEALINPPAYTAVVKNGTTGQPNSTGDQSTQPLLSTKDIVIVTLSVMLSLVILIVLAVYVQRKLNDLNQKLNMHYNSNNSRKESDSERSSSSSKKWWIDPAKGGKTRSIFFKAQQPYQTDPSLFSAPSDLSSANARTVKPDKRKTMVDMFRRKDSNLLRELSVARKLPPLSPTDTTMVNSPAHHFIPKQPNTPPRTPPHSRKESRQGLANSTLDQTFTAPSGAGEAQSSHGISAETYYQYQHFHGGHGGGTAADSHASIYTIPTRTDSQPALDPRHPNRTRSSVYGIGSERNENIANQVGVAPPSDPSVLFSLLQTEHAQGLGTFPNYQGPGHGQDGSKRSSLLYNAATSASTNPGKAVSFSNSHRKLPTLIPLSLIHQYHGIDGGGMTKKELSPLDEMSEPASSVQSVSGLTTAFHNAGASATMNTDYRDVFEYVLSSPMADGELDQSSPILKEAGYYSGITDISAATSAYNRDGQKRESVWSMSDKSDSGNSVAHFAQEQGMLKKEVEQLIEDQRRKKEQLVHDGEKRRQTQRADVSNWR